MILICEIMTEEPDGGSAMIPLETFLDLYTFLAGIDASKPQLLKNYYFTDAVLSVWKKAKEKEVRQGKEVKEESVIEEERWDMQLLQRHIFCGNIQESQAFI